MSGSLGRGAMVTAGGRREGAPCPENVRPCAGLPYKPQPQEPRLLNLVHKPWPNILSATTPSMQASPKAESLKPRSFKRNPSSQHTLCIPIHPCAVSPQKCCALCLLELHLIYQKLWFRSICPGMRLLWNKPHLLFVEVGQGITGSADRRSSAFLQTNTKFLWQRHHRALLTPSHVNQGMPKRRCKKSNVRPFGCPCTFTHCPQIPCEF